MSLGKVKTCKFCGDQHGEKELCKNNPEGKKDDPEIHQVHKDNVYHAVQMKEIFLLPCDWTKI